MINISHLLFADDILVFCEANPDHLRFLRVLLVCFEVVFGLKVNLAKSLLVPVGNVDNVAELASILGCGTSSLPLKYLGHATRLRPFGMILWLRWSAVWSVGKSCFCLRVLGLPSSRVHPPTSLRISCLFSHSYSCG